ncbi:MAG: AMP-dependent synthetase [Actinobacteria bacterium]|jgi:acyl-CoA synthetase (AMP-forming)/AMP-acid ligase II|nr:MAG: AMP-dependent synthetase [Actinomycetota bacterium]
MEYPWFKEYEIVGIPKTLMPYPDEPSHYFLDQAAEKRPKMGCVQMGLEISYSELREHADRFANALAGMGVDKGDRIATLLPTSAQFIIADAGISKAGAVHVPCSFLEPLDTLSHKFTESSPKAIICLEEDLPLAESLREFMSAPNIIITRVDDYSDRPSPRAEVPDAMWLTDIIAQARPEPPRVSIEPSKDLETLLFTGGTTGLPKGCMLTHRNTVANAMQNPAMFGPIAGILEGNVSVLIGLPFFHSYGHCIMHTMINGMYNLLIITDPRDTKSMLRMIHDYNPVLQFGVPTQFMKLLDEDIKATRIIGISGSAALPPTVQEKFEKESKTFVSEGYGLSELSPVTHFNVSANIRAMGGRKMVPVMNKLMFNAVNKAFMNFQAKMLGPKTYGKIFLTILGLVSDRNRKSDKLKSVEKRATIGIPVPDTVIKVVEVDSGRTIPFREMVEEGAVGELLLDGPQRMLGYWPEPGRGLDEEGFVHTGDVVKMDENGYFSIVDRTKDMAIVSGYKVYTREVDDILYDHPATEVAATIGVPDPEREGSERIKVFIQLRAEYRGKVSEDDYISYLREKVAKYAVPRSIVFLEEMPLTEVFKVNKKVLRELELEEMNEA